MQPRVVPQHCTWLPVPAGIWAVSVGQGTANVALEGREVEDEREGRSVQTEGIMCQMHQDVTDHACQNPVRSVLCLAGGKRAQKGRLAPVCKEPSVHTQRLGFDSL